MPPFVYMVAANGIFNTKPSTRPQYTWTAFQLHVYPKAPHPSLGVIDQPCKTSIYLQPWGTQPPILYEMIDQPSETSNHCLPQGMMDWLSETPTYPSPGGPIHLLPGGDQPT